MISLEPSTPNCDKKIRIPPNSCFECRGSSNRHRTRHPPRDLQEAGLHVDDLVFAVSFAGEEALQAIGLEPDGTVDEAVLVGAGVVPERIRVPERDVRRVLERAAAVGAGRLREEPALRGQAAMDFLHRVDRIGEVFEDIVRSECADLAIGKRPAIAEFGGDLSTVEFGQPEPGVAVRTWLLRFHRPEVYTASANRRRQHGHSPSKPLTSAVKADGCGSVMIALNASGALCA